MNYFIASLKLNLISSLRNKQVQFFDFFLPLFLFIIFSFIFSYPRFSYFSITIVLILSYGLYSIGPVIKIYQINEFDKLLKLLPKNPFIFYLAFIFSRFLLSFISFTLLTICAYIIFIYFNENFKFEYVLRGIICLIFGISIFGFLSLVIFRKEDEDINFLPLNLIFYITLFLGGVFFPPDILPGFFKYIPFIFPTNYMMMFMLGKNLYVIGIILWFILSLFIYFIFSKK